MYIVEELTGPDGKGHAIIELLEDGHVRGIILRKEKIEAQRTNVERSLDNYEVCAFGETLNSVKPVVYEELGL